MFLRLFLFYVILCAKTSWFTENATDCEKDRQAVNRPIPQMHYNISCIVSQSSLDRQATVMKIDWDIFLLLPHTRIFLPVSQVSLFIIYLLVITGTFIDHSRVWLHFIVTFCEPSKVLDVLTIPPNRKGWLSAKYQNE